VCISVITAVKKVMISVCFCLSVGMTMQAKYSNNFHKLGEMVAHRPWKNPVDSGGDMMTLHQCDFRLFIYMNVPRLQPVSYGGGAL